MEALDWRGLAFGVVTQSVGRSVKLPASQHKNHRMQHMNLQYILTFCLVYLTRVWKYHGVTVTNLILQLLQAVENQ